MTVLWGVMLHGFGAFCASICYAPQKKTVRWAWQTFWLAQAVVCWLAMPLIGAWLTIPDLLQVLREAPASAMVMTFVLGALYGIGGTAFGISIRYLGLSLTYAIAVGISCVLGTLLPPLVHQQLLIALTKTGSGWVMAGISAGAIGIALCGIAGRKKELDLDKDIDGTTSFSFSKGLPVCILAGLLSAVFGFALDQGQPIADIAAKYGAGNFQGNVIYIFSNTGAFFTTLIYCLYLHYRDNTFKEFVLFSRSSGSTPLLTNFGLAFLTGILWYSQFFFYGLGHVRMGEYKFSSWAIHMIMLVLFSAMIGVLFKEWSACKPQTKKVLTLALTVLIIAVLLLSYGNYLGEVHQ